MARWRKKEKKGKEEENFASIASTPIRAITVLSMRTAVI